MKLIYIANARIPTEKAHGIQIMQMCEAFAKHNPNATNKVEVELVLPKRFNDIKKDPFKYYGVERNFEIKKLPCLDFISLDKYIGHLGLWIESISFNFFVFFYLIFKKADIIYTRDRFLTPFILVRKNIVFELHTFPKNFFLHSPFIKKIKKIIVITNQLKNLLIKKKILPNKILVVPDGIDIEKFDVRCSMFEARKKLNLPLDKKIVLYMGHLYEWKGAQTLAEAFRYLLKDIEIYFVGGTAEDKKKFKIRNLKLEINVISHRPHAEIPYWLKAADVLVLPNTAKKEISKYWTSPLKLFEYMASKRPIVASNLPSTREILNEKNAVLVKPDSPEELSRGIKKILQNPEFYTKISNQAFQDVKQYTWEKRSKRILSFVVKQNATFN